MRKPRFEQVGQIEIEGAASLGATRCARPSTEVGQVELEVGGACSREVEITSRSSTARHGQIAEAWRALRARRKIETVAGQPTDHGGKIEVERLCLGRPRHGDLGQVVVRCGPCGERSGSTRGRGRRSAWAGRLRTTRRREISVAAIPTDGGKISVQVRIRSAGRRRRGGGWRLRDAGAWRRPRRPTGRRSGAGRSSRRFRWRRHCDG